MAKTFLDLDGLTQYDTLLKEHIDAAGTQVSGKITAESTRATGEEAQLRDTLGAQSDAAKAAEQAISEAIDAINDADNGILKKAEDYADTKDKAIADAKQTAVDASASMAATTEKVGYNATTEVPSVKDYADVQISGSEDEIDDVRKAVNAEGERAQTAEGILDNLAADITDNSSLVGAISAVDAKINAITDEIKDISELVGTGYGSGVTVQNYIDNKIAGYEHTLGLPTSSIVDDIAVEDYNYKELKNKIGEIPASITLVKNIEDVIGSAQEIADEKTVLTITPKTTGLEDGIKKAYEFSQNSTILGTVKLPKDLHVISGAVEKRADGTYLVFQVENGEPIVVNVAKLVNDFTVQENADQVQLAVSDDRELSATIKAGSVSMNEIDKEIEKEVTITADNVTDLDTRVTDLEGKIGDTDVKSKIDAAIEALDSEVTFKDGGVTLTLSAEDGSLSAIDADLDAIPENDILKMFITEVSGFYDAAGEMIVNWSALGIDAEADYTQYTAPIKDKLTQYPATKKVVLPQEIVKIGNYLFYGCDRLTEVNYFPGIISIGNNTFDGCSDLLVIKEYEAE